MSLLSGKVAVVTGASRGIGKGIATALGSHGATVYVTGRTVNAGTYELPGTVGETAFEVDRRGGRASQSGLTTGTMMMWHPFSIE